MDTIFQPRHMIFVGMMTGLSLMSWYSYVSDENSKHAIKTVTGKTTPQKMATASMISYDSRVDTLGR